VSSLQERRTLSLKHGDCFAVFDPTGDAVAEADSPEGFYVRALDISPPTS
jgi:hypothetical protein